MKSPAEIIDAAASAGASKAHLTRTDTLRLLVSAIQAGAFIALGGILSLIIGFGFPGITGSNPALQKILSGAVFPIGLILTVSLGAELFTGNNAVLVSSWMRGHHGPGLTLRNWVMVYIGNFIGAMLFTTGLVWMCGLTSAEPWHGAAVRIAEAKVSMPWLTVFLKAVGANWCVCLGVWLALSAKTFQAKALGCWIPVMAFVALGYEHCIANMFFIPLGMLEGAQVGIWESVTANFIPSTLGNIAGGALLVGCLNTYLHTRRGKKA